MRYRGLSTTIWALGLGSLFMDISSELVHSVLPLFMAGTLGASAALIGLVEGIAEATAAFTKVFSGALSDRLGRRKPLLLFGYSLAALTKPVFPLAHSIGWVMFARFTDRVGKGIRGAPRDALVADITAPEQRGAAYGLRQALDSVGALLGPLLAIGLLALWHDDLQLAMWVAVVPAFVTVLILWRFVQEPAQHELAGRAPPTWRDARRLPARFWGVSALGGVFTLARFSEAFLLLRGQDAGMSLTEVPAVLVAMNLVYALGAYPAGWLSDRFEARRLLFAGLAVLVASDLLLARAGSPAGVFAGALAWGLHMALTQGLFNKLVADTAPADLRGSAFGVFNLLSGVAVLLASVVAGALWSRVGPQATFFVGAGFAVVTGLGLLFAPRRRPTIAG